MYILVLGGEILDTVATHVLIQVSFAILTIVKF